LAAVYHAVLTAADVDTDTRTRIAQRKLSEVARA